MQIMFTSSLMHHTLKYIKMQTFVLFTLCMVAEKAHDSLSNRGGAFNFPNIVIL